MSIKIESKALVAQLMLLLLLLMLYGQTAWAQQPSQMMFPNHMKGPDTSHVGHNHAVDEHAVHNHTVHNHAVHIDDEHLGHDDHLGHDEDEAHREGMWQGLLSFYMHSISPVDGDRCSMAPVCSLYAQQALDEYGILGVFLTADRLLHESDQIALSPSFEENGEVLSYDPLANNVYWFSAEH